MKRIGSTWCVVTLAAWLAVFLAPPAAAQDTSKTADQTKATEQTSEGIDSGNYNFQQTVELGYRTTDFTGNRAVFDTFVNLRDGMRLLDYSLNIRSLNHSGALFDNLYLTSFGYGGDPNNVSFIRAYKNKWYSFTGQFRRDLNFWDYDLLTNPLNPANPFINVLNSPHSFHTARRMSDFNLIVMPQSRMRLRLAYNRNISEGPALSTIHEGTDALLLQNWKTTVNSYQIGVDFKMLPKTNISYDQFFNYYKGDTTWADQALSGSPFFLSPFQLSNGAPVDAGLIYSATAGQPCGNAPVPIFSPGTPPVLKSVCNGFTDGAAQFSAGSPAVTIPGYDRAGRARSKFPTEQLSFQSSYFKNLDLSGRAIYSGSESSVLDFQELLFGFITRTSERAFSWGGPARSHNVSTTADLAATYRINKHLRVVDEFRFRNYKIPGVWLFDTTSLFSTTSPASLLSAVAVTPQACLTTPCVHGGSSPADIANGFWSKFFKQDVKMNTIQLEYDFTRRLGVRAGYRIRHRTIDDGTLMATTETFFPGTANRGDCALASGNLPPGCTSLGNGAFQFVTPTPLVPDTGETTINEHSGLFGIWARPSDKLRASFDLELMSADNAFTRISPRNLQHYKLRSTYEPREWLHLATAIDLLENRNNVFEVDNKQHDRNYSFNATFQHSDRFAFDLDYEYSDVFSTTNICFAFSPIPAGTHTPPPCPVSANGVAPLSGISNYNSRTHFAFFDTMWKPVKRVTTNLGYSVVTTSGETNILNPNAPPGSLEYNFHKPYANLILDLFKGLSYKTSWGYYGYNEREPADLITGSRKFRGNLATFSVRYSF
jgi:hypothetical protein